MYRLVLYYLVVLLLLAVVFSSFKLLPSAPLDIIISTLVFLVFSWATNQLFAKVFKAQVNTESVYITALILALIVTPAQTLSDFVFLFWVSVLAMASKYILALGQKHLFNPAAIAVVITALFANHSASWWVGNSAMFPFVAVGGLLIVRKIKREDLVFYFLLTTLAVTTLIAILHGSNITLTLSKVIINSSLAFFAFVMLTEPLTTPPTKVLQAVYGALTGLLFVPQIHLFGLFSTPELALVSANVVSYLVSSKAKLTLSLLQKIKISPDTFDFIFPRPEKFTFQAGQYLEMTLSHDHVDARGNRRYFTIASSPTENTLRLGVKFYEPGSSFKKALLNLDNQTPVVLSQLAGDFVLPKNKNQKLVFIAGGIGITPFRSILKYLTDTKEARDIVLIFSNKHAEDIVYQDVFTAAAQTINLKIIYTLTDLTHLPADWSGHTGRISADLIKQEIPDYSDRLYYLSGTHSMVEGFKETLGSLALKKSKIIVDYFPGFA